MGHKKKSVGEFAAKVVADLQPQPDVGVVEDRLEERRAKPRRAEDEYKIIGASVSDLEKLLESEEETPIVIMPNGQIREATDKERQAHRERKPLKVLTMLENLGGEYARL